MPSQADIEIARKAVKNGLASAEDVRECMREMAEMEKSGEKRSLLDLMKDKGWLSDSSVEALRGGEAPSPTAVTVDMPEDAFVADVAADGAASGHDACPSDGTPMLPGAGPERRKGDTAEQAQETIFAEFRRRAWRDSQRLASAALADYDPIVQRNLFGIGGSPDPTDHTYLTAVSSVDGEPQVWFTLRAAGEVLKLRKGDGLEVGQFSGTIAEIEGSDVVIEADDGERWLLTLGESLTDAYALPPEF